ncbi:uncharacterized protein LOC121302192 [Polyodon spathula]|uniref:uncharacterized protein LOC121302091 n=1 Tax=Polyodon spathula TaxID=7913 RepID=UPI001B7EB5C5|nr:uncharacterized protein LOC121302091 [Polyodon spathula]XP_041087943.1 uncharacterized protein LOC121302192 [Polyodon spathula]
MEFPGGSSGVPVGCRDAGIELQAGVPPEGVFPKKQVPGSLSEASRSWEMKENGPSPPTQLLTPPAPRRRRKERGGLLPLDPVPADQLSAVPGENGQNSGEQSGGGDVAPPPSSSSLSPSRIAHLDPTFPSLPEGLFQPFPLIDFAEVTSADLGIAAQSFTPRWEVKGREQSGRQAGRVRHGRVTQSSFCYQLDQPPVCLGNKLRCVSLLNC